MLTAAQQELVLQFRGLACRQAIRQHRKTGLDLDELKGEAIYQLCRVAAWFDPAKGSPFAPIAAHLITQWLTKWSLKQMSIPFVTEAVKDVPSPARKHDAAKAAESAELAAILRRNCRSKEWVILWSYYAEGYTFDEIGERLGVSGSAIHDRFHRVMRRLKATDDYQRLLRCE